jgi:hypothetical protein
MDITGVIGGAAAGALLAALAGLWGAWRQSRREHATWVRERRYEAYTRAYALVKGFDLNASKTDKIRDSFIAQLEKTPEKDISVQELLDDPRLQAMLDHADDLYLTVAETLAPIALMGPDHVAAHFVDMQTAYEAEDKEALGAAEVAFLAAARKVLNIQEGQP